MTALEIKENRKRLNLTQEALGKLLGVSKRTIINYENGEVVPETKSELLHQILLSEEMGAEKDAQKDLEIKFDPLLDALLNKLKNYKPFNDYLDARIDDKNRELMMAMLNEEIGKTERLLEKRGKEKTRG